MKKITLTLLSAIALLLTACSGGSSSEEIIMESDFVLIINYAPSGICDLNTFQNAKIDDILSFATLEVLEDPDPGVTCDKYGMNARECTEVEYPNTKSVSCVIGADTNELFDNLEDIVDLIEELVG